MKGTGIMSSKVYERDLGNDTLKVFQATDRYNPDKSWLETTGQVFNTRQ